MFNNKNLLLLGLAILFTTGCSQKENSIGSKMMESANLEKKDLSTKKELAEKWDKGSKLLANGKEQVEDGEDYVKKGENLINEGKDNISEGKNLIEESEKEFKLKFPGIKLSK